MINPSLTEKLHGTVSRQIGPDSEDGRSLQQMVYAGMPYEVLLLTSDTLEVQSARINIQNPPCIIMALLSLLVSSSSVEWDGLRRGEAAAAYSREGPRPINTCPAQ